MIRPSADSVGRAFMPHRKNSISQVQHKGLRHSAASSALIDEFAT